MSVRVVARIRPLLDQELDKDTIVRVESSSDGKPATIVKIPSPKNPAEEFSFAFNGVYDMPTTQEELFTKEVAPTLKSLFQGLDVTIFAYGVTGTGKTHTMRGGLKLTERGVIPRLLSGIYRRGRKVAKDTSGATSIAVTLSYYEIYNDKVYDLFEQPENRSASGLPLRESGGGKTVVVGLSEHCCEDLKEFERLYIEANNNRSTAGTKLNAQSSRSHAILMVKLIQTTGDQILTSTASAIDLAGSEDNRRTENGKERMVESASINKSLFVLSQCIDAIGKGEKRIPYRESKMTRILSLGQNNGITIMILNLAPLKSYHLDTLSSLNVSSRAKRIEVREIENEVVFKQQPRPASSVGASLKRQPLRPLANNTNIPNVAAGQKGDKPPKMFSVYSDKSRTGGGQLSATGIPNKKRISDQNLNSRPTKLVKSAPVTSGISAAKIEEMVERKVSEILAARALDQPAPPAPVDTISEAVQRRLDALERKIESGNQEDGRADGLRFLLMAKQHKERGEDASALKMYELAAPFFPGQEKLQRKMENLRIKIREKKEGVERAPTGTKAAPACAPIVKAPMEEEKFSPIEKQRQQKHKVTNDENDENDGSFFEAEGPSVYDDEDSFAFKPSKVRSSKPKTTSKSTTKFQFQPSPLDQQFAALQAIDQTILTPRREYILSVVNSRDIAQIKKLPGIGAKKAKDLLEFLELRSEEDGGSIDCLADLRDIPGIGEKVIDKMMQGVVVD